ncbi:MAG: efflux RND transporter permease subunit [Lentisphaeria bacterium]
MISEVFIRRPVATILLTVVLCAFGVWSYLRLPVSSLPTVDYPVIQVTVYYPGASPETMATTVATPLENQFTQINGLASMLSDNKEGSTTINLTFDLDRNVDAVATDVQAAISRAQNLLPKDLPSPPTYQKFNPSDAPIYYLLLYSDTLTEGDLYDYGNIVIAKKLSMLEGVSQVQTYGAQRCVRVQFIPERLAAYQLGIDEVVSALQAGTVSIPGGSLNGTSRSFTIEPQGQLRSAKEYAPLIIAYRDNAPVRLRDVANCVDSINNDIVDIRYNTPGKPERSNCVVMAISRVAGSNTVAVADMVTKTIAKLQRDLPGDVHTHVVHNGADAIRDSIHDVEVTVLIALSLVVLVIFLFLGRIRETVIPAITIPVSLLGTYVLMDLAGFNLDTLSLMGIVLAIGFLVDDAIVVLENTVRHLDSGMKPIPAAIRSMKEITITLISTSAALVVVFTPLVFMSGAVGRNLREFALTVIFAIVVSTLVALLLSPMMCARILRHHQKENWLQKAITATIDAMIRSYGVLLAGTLKHRWISVLGWTVCILGTGVLFKKLPQTFLPPGDSSFIMGAMLTPLGSSTEAMSRYQQKVAATLRQNPEILDLVTVTGFQPGADQSMGYIFCRLKPPRERAPIDQIAQQFTMQLGPIPDGFSALSAVPVLKISSGAETTQVGSDYAYLLTGFNRQDVYAASQKLQQAMYGIPGIFPLIQNTIKLTMPRLSVEIDRDRASALGITAQQIEQALGICFSNNYVALFTTDNDQYQVIPEIAKERQRRPTDLEYLYVRSRTTNQLVPLRSLVSWHEEAGPQDVPHANQQEAATLSFSLLPGVAMGDVTTAIDKTAAGILPHGVSGTFIGDALEFNKSVVSLGILLLVAIFLKYVVLGVLYESYIHPFTILTTLPVAVFGGLLTLLAFQSMLSLYAYIGLFVLIGLITKNGILMVDFAEQRRAEGKNAHDAIYDACLVRFRPILMTGLCSILGAMPIALGYGADAESRIPLGLVVVGGMVFAQVITLFITPGIYLIMDSLQTRFFKPRTDLE